jgi:prolyl oligopeptidase
MPALKYPTTRTTNQVDDYHGKLVVDPYRWLEDVDAPETLAWIDAQNRLTFQYLEQITARTPIHQRLTDLWDFPKKTAPIRRGGVISSFATAACRTRRPVCYARSWRMGMSSRSEYTFRRARSL